MKKSIFDLIPRDILDELEKYLGPLHIGVNQLQAFRQYKLRERYLMVVCYHFHLKASHRYMYRPDNIDLSIQSGSIL